VAHAAPRDGRIHAVRDEEALPVRLVLRTAPGQLPGVQDLSGVVEQRARADEASVDRYPKRVDVREERVRRFEHEATVPDEALGRAQLDEERLGVLGRLDAAMRGHRAGR